MSFLPRFLLCLTLLLPVSGYGQETVRFRQWIAGQETGGVEVRTQVEGARRRIDSREWMRLERLGLSVEQEIRQTLWRAPDGAIQAQWAVQLAQEPMEGESTWNPAIPNRLQSRPKGMPPSEVELPAGTVLWPEEADARLMAAAAKRERISLKTYALPLQQVALLDLECLGADPLPGFPEAVRFKGKSQEGPICAEVEVWVSPTRGDLRHQGKIMGMDFLLQRAELPAPGPASKAQGFFETTLSNLPPQPLRLWLRDITVTWSGTQPPVLPEDAQQIRLAATRYRLRQSAPPTPQEAQEPPVEGKPTPEDRPYLASTPLVRLEDPVFDGLLSRLNAPKEAPRWALAQRVTAFVYEWIESKDYSVGFATAQEVARNGRGDCTEHGVLAIALLRRLGVPCRAVAGWVALENTLGLHFWVEVKLGSRWVPIDPTFDQAPASAFRLKLSVSDLADLNNLGWETASMNVKDGAWRLDQPWPQGMRNEGERLRLGDGLTLVARGRTWSPTPADLRISGNPPVPFEATLRPYAAQLRGARRVMGTSGHRGWWSPGIHTLWLELGRNTWARLGPVEEGQALELLEAISSE